MSQYSHLFAAFFLAYLPFYFESNIPAQSKLLTSLLNVTFYLALWLIIKRFRPLSSTPTHHIWRAIWVLLLIPLAGIAMLAIVR